MKFFPFLFLFTSVILSCDTNRSDVERFFKEHPELSSINKDTVLIIEGKEVRIIQNLELQGADDLERVTSVNGAIMYEYSYDATGIRSVSKVFSYDFMNESYDVYISNDSIRFGEMFNGFIYAREDDIIAIIDGQKFKLNNDDLPFSYDIQPVDTGLHVFSGEIYHRGKMKRFNYKYYVH